MRQHAACLCLIAASAVAEPLPTRDQNPLLAGFGLPRPVPVRVEKDWRLGADFSWGSTASIQSVTIQSGASESLTVDAETRELRFTLDGRLNPDWLIAASVPWRSTSAGSLDGFIDGWHDFFSLPEGKRNDLPRDDLRVLYRNGPVRRIDRTDSMSGVGDIDLAIGRQLLNSQTTALTGWLDVKLPSGDFSELNGSGALDASLIVAGAQQLNERWSIFGQLGITHLGEGDFLPEKQRDWVGTATAGVTRRLWQALDLTVQFDAHSAAFDSDLDYLGDALILNFGGAWHFANGLVLTLGLSEDIVVEASPDVVFIVGVRRAL